MVLYVAVFGDALRVWVHLTKYTRQNTGGPSVRNCMKQPEQSEETQWKQMDARRLRGVGGELGKLKITYGFTNFTQRQIRTYYLDVQLGLF
jgi:hypothetical protein